MGKNSTKDDLLYIILFFGLIVWVGILCFYHLGEAGTQNWDEARHIVNAYEMMKSGRMWIHTYLYETDYYNFKPPLSMWCIMSCFQILGIDFFTMRLYSAVSMMLLFLFLSIFTAYVFGKKASLISAVVLASGTDLFFFHMARSADADALYLLLFTLAMICLYLTEKKPWFFVGTSLFLSLAFLAKCFHVAVGGVILIFYLPRIWKSLKWKHWIGAMGGAACRNMGIRQIFL